MLRKVNWRELGMILQHADLRWALSGWALTLLLIAILAFRWRLFLDQQQVNIPFSTIFQLTWAGQFFNSILPGSTGGDVVKIYQLCRLLPQRKAAVAASVVADRFTALAILILLAGAAFLARPEPFQLLVGNSVKMRVVLTWAGVAVMFGAVAAWIVWRVLRRTYVAARIGRVFFAVRECFVLTPRLGVAILSALALHLLNFTIVFLFARALGLTITYLQTLVMMPVILFVVMTPVTINGHGLREVLLIAYLTVLNVNVVSHPEFKTLDTAVALSLVTVANDLLWSLPGGLWYLIKVRSLPRSVAVSE